MTGGPFVAPRLFNVKKISGWLGLIKTLMTIYFYRSSVSGCFGEFKNIFVNIPEIVIFLLYKDLKNMLDTHVLRNLVTSLNIFCLPTFLLKYSEQGFS